MTFKKDYINYVVYSVINGNDGLRHNRRLKSLVGKIISTDDIVKITYLVGKTAGLELLFKYLLYISDKIDKSQITIFNLKDNFDYDVQNLLKVFEKLASYKSDNVNKKIDSIEIPEGKQKGIIEKTKAKDEKTRIKFDATRDEEVKSSEEIPEQDDEEYAEDENGPSLTLIENTGTGVTEAEVFELSEISDDIENSVSDSSEETVDTSINNTETKEDTEDEENENDNIIEDSTGEKEEDMFELDEIEDEVDGKGKVIIDSSSKPAVSSEKPNVEIEVRKPTREFDESEDVVKEESVTNEAYYKFESKFFEEVKILEKLFLTVEKDYKAAGSTKLSEKCLQSLTEIMEITSELSNLSRQLSFDLIADIFLTMNLYFTKTISAPELITSERIRLLDSSLSLVNSLIKGEDYLNYDVIVDKIELLKSDMMRPAEAVKEFKPDSITQDENVNAIDETEEETAVESEEPEEITAERIVAKDPGVKQADLDSVNFKMRYLIKEFEKSFTGIGNIKGEYKRFDALDKIDELNNALRLIAKIAAGVKMKDVLKLSEVAYVFLKYLKDYRMDLLDPEIQQIVKYIIFTFKMLLTERKPEDFNVLVQYLNNPVKIFADS